MESTAAGSFRINKLSLLGSYVPRQCGIATFTKDLRDAIAGHIGESSTTIQAVDDIPGGYDYPDEVKYQILARRIKPYRTAAEMLNLKQADVAIVQHEYGIYGGIDGNHVTHYMRHLKMPIITTLHTVLTDPTPGQREVIHQIADFSDRLVVMSHLAEHILQDVYDVPSSQIAYIPHGIPDVPFVDPIFHKDRFDAEGRKVLLTFGLLSPGKGIEVAIRALPRVIERHPEAIYIVLGATHPHVLRKMGNSYRQNLNELANDLGVTDHIRFHEQFVSLEELCCYIGAADIYLTPYLNKAQITSGTLAYALGAGKAVVSTPYWHAEEMLADGRGRLFDFNDHEQLADTLNELLDDESARDTMRKKAYQHCRPMVWREVGKSYIELAEKILADRNIRPQPIKVLSSAAQPGNELPQINLAHLYRLTDDTGILQHAVYGTPNRHHGYCIDDNARALIAALMYRSLYNDESVMQLADIYLAFMNHALIESKGGFHNFMSYDRKWLDEVGSEDAQGRTLWALGLTASMAGEQAMTSLATELFDKGIGYTRQMQYPRAWAFSILGLQGYLHQFPGDRKARLILVDLGRRLHRLFAQNAGANWPWCENMLTYDNARLPHGLVVAGQLLEEPAMIEQGLQSLDWLLDLQMTDDGHISLIGNDGWMDRSGHKARFDQQPLDAAALVQACSQAYHVTEDSRWIDSARKCLQWFTGENDTRSMIFDEQTGGCRDGLEWTGPNLNQGAESTLSWLIALMTVVNLSRSEVLDQQDTIESFANRSSTQPHEDKIQAGAGDSNPVPPTEGTH